MKLQILSSLILLTLGTTSCGSDDGLDSNRGGPHSLIGFQWESETTEVNDLKFKFGVKFDKSSVELSNTCNDSLTVKVTAPVLYQYSALVRDGAKEKTESNGKECFVEIAKSTFDFEIRENKLWVTIEGEMLGFTPAASGVAGLYGEWEAAAPGIGKLVWSLGNGEIEATAHCDNGLTATTIVSAEFENKLTFPEAATEVSKDEFGLECMASIAKAATTYTFDGEDLLWTTNGKEIRLKHK